MSPSNFQLFLSKSPIATQQKLGTSGGCGWQALEMGMGKTAVVIAGILFNPPPLNWRNARPWTPHDPSDHMITVKENMPRGGTLVIVPTTLLRQWEIEIEKTLDNPQELSVLVWNDARRTLDCNEIASYDIVLTTPLTVTKSFTMASIFWHRIVVDEAQLNAGSLMSRGDMMSTHRWIVTGTPCNAEPESIGPSLDFLRLGGYGPAQKHLPPALATVMRAVMLRYTKDGVIDGETNLELPPLIPRVLSCRLNAEDATWEKKMSREMYNKLTGDIERGIRKSGFEGVPIAEVLGKFPKP